MWILNLLLVATWSAARPDDAVPGTLIVLNKSEASASLIDLPTRTVRATLKTGVGPHEVAVSPDGDLAVVADYGQRTPGRTLTVLDLLEGKVQRTIDLGQPRRPHGIVWLEEYRVLVTAEQTQSVLEVDVDTGEIVQEIPTDQQVSHMLAATADGRRAFVANIGSGSVTVLDLVAAENLASIRTGAGAEGITLAANGSEVWITNRQADTITVLNTTTRSRVAEMPCPGFPIRAAVLPDQRHVLVSCATSAEVAVFDAREKQELRRIPMKLEAVNDDEDRLFANFDGAVPVGIVVHPEGRHAYIANTQADLVSVIDLKEWKVVDLLKAGKEPDGMAYSPVRVPARER